MSEQMDQRRIWVYRFGTDTRPMSATLVAAYSMQEALDMWMDGENEEPEEIELVGQLVKTVPLPEPKGGSG